MRQWESVRDSTLVSRWAIVWMETDRAARLVSLQDMYRPSSVPWSQTQGYIVLGLQPNVVGSV